MSSAAYDGPVRVGQVRPSQIMHTFGIGGLIDLPHLSVIVNGLHDWDERHSAELSEPRLLSLVRRRGGLRGVKSLRRPPWMPETQNALDDWARVGIPVTPFPRWLRCPWGSCQYLGPIDDGQFEKSVNAYQPEQAAYVHKNCRRKGKGATGVPVRFMLVCERGHLDEFPWVEFVHKRQDCSQPLLEMFERGMSAGPADVFVKCRTCKASRAMSDAFGDQGKRSLPTCRGRHPHLGMYEANGCSAPMRALLLGASNSWFAAQLAVLSIPASQDPIPTLVAELWPVLEEIDDPDMLTMLLRRDPGLSRLADYSSDDVWAAMEAHRSSPGSAAGDAPVEADVLMPEWHQFTHPEDAPDTDDFRLRSEDLPNRFADRLEQVVRAERLREVVAFCGFTRLSSGSESTSDSVAPLSKYPPHWVPAVEVRGEGIFSGLPEKAVTGWEEQYRSSTSYEQLVQSHKNWGERRGLDPASGWPGARYVLLHTLSHLLMREFALDCGYSASSIRERIYARTGTHPMAGFLLYTAAPDSEGTLGGLVSLADPERLERLFTQALEHAGICTSDPTCAEHVAGRPGTDDVHGAACHACLFASETSCERGNRYLDRAALIETLARGGAPYFTA